MSAPKPADALSVAFAEALGYFQAKDIITPDAWVKLEDTAKARALSVAGVTKLDVIKSAWAALERAIAKGTTLDDFKAEIGPLLARHWSGTPEALNWRLELVFRNNLQAAYNYGRFEATTHPDVVDLRPFRKFDAVMDSRTTAICQKCDGTTLPIDHPWWDGHVPPCHHACRSGFISLSRAQAEREGITKKAPQIDAGPGFGGLPSLAAVQPSAATPPELAAAYASGAGGAAQPPAGGPPALPPAGGGGGSDGGGRKPPEDHPPPESGKYGESWEPGQRRSFLYSLGTLDDRRPPWHLDAEDRPPGRDFERLDHGASFDKDAKPPAEFCRKQGNDLYPLRKAKNAAGVNVKGPDGAVNMEPPAHRLPPFSASEMPASALVEIKRLQPPAGKSSTTVKALMDLRDSVKRAVQARNVVIDATASGWALDAALELARSIRNSRHILRDKAGAQVDLRLSLDFVRIVGHDFDVTIQVDTP